MNKKNQSKAHPEFHYMVNVKGDRTEFDYLRTICDPLEELRYIITKSPSTGCWKNIKTDGIFWRPKIGDVYVSLSNVHKLYATAAGAYRVAVKIKAAMIQRLKELEAAYARRPQNLKIINEHYIGRITAV